MTIIETTYPECQTCDDHGVVENYCSACNGSGEGSYDGSICSQCHGSGIELISCPDCNKLEGE